MSALKPTKEQLAAYRQVRLAWKAFQDAKIAATYAGITITLESNPSGEYFFRARTSPYELTSRDLADDTRVETE